MDKYFVKLCYASWSVKTLIVEANTFVEAMEIIKKNHKIDNLVSISIELVGYNTI